MLAFICIVLIGVLGAIFVTSKKSEREEAQRLEKLASDQQKGIEDYESVKEHAAELEKEDGSETDSSVASEPDDSTDSADEADSTESSEKENISAADETEDNTDSTDSTADAERTVSGVVCWGDDLINGTDSDTYSYMAVLQKLLAENGYSNSVLQSYITKHQQAANGAQLNVTETGIRDLTEEQTTRNDMDCIPVIFMGYYGGWNHDPQELTEQQENILNTFQNKDEFIVVGTRPMDGTVTSEALDEVLSQKWGEHYISLASVTSQPASTKEAQQTMAEAILQKLEELGYISKN